MHDLKPREFNQTNVVLVSYVRAAAGLRTADYGAAATVGEASSSSSACSKSALCVRTKVRYSHYITCKRLVV